MTWGARGTGRRAGGGCALKAKSPPAALTARRRVMHVPVPARGLRAGATATKARTVAVDRPPRSYASAARDTGAGRSEQRSASGRTARGGRGPMRTGISAVTARAWRRRWVGRGVLRVRLGLLSVDPVSKRRKSGRSFAFWAIYGRGFSGYFRRFWAASGEMVGLDGFLVVGALR